jgi:hypothetical protein
VEGVGVFLLIGSLFFLTLLLSRFPDSGLCRYGEFCQGMRGGIFRHNFERMRELEWDWFEDGAWGQAEPAFQQKSK